MPKLTVVGSISTDFVIETDKQPLTGETVEGNHFSTSFGGKGANQAIAAARLGAEVSMVGAVGKDSFGKDLLDNLSDHNVSIKGVEKVDEPSGTAFITLHKGDNSIIYVPGANGSYNSERLQTFMKDKQTIQTSDLVMVQNETPEDTVHQLIETCFKWEVPLLLNPAPARSLDTDLIEKVTFLTPNETECAVLFPDEEMEDVLKRYPNKLIITLGSKGAIFFDGESIQHVLSLEVKNVVDTTGAGDTFNGAFAFANTSGFSIKESIQFANFAAGLSIQKMGAQSGSPTLEELKKSAGFNEE